MSSTNIVNFSLRQNKCIERAVTFDCFSAFMRALGLRDAVYVGLGSVWFSDFILAHRMLGIDSMVSIEADDIIFKRATFNKLYRTLEVLQGGSAQVIPTLLDREDLVDRPWIVWLDYDKAVDEGKLEELVELVRSLPANSFLVTTLNVHGGNYGKVEARPKRIKTLFEDAAPEELDPLETRNQGNLSRVLAQSTQDFLVSKAIQAGRRGSLVPAIRLMYRDSAPMITVGGILPSAENEETARQLVSSPEWPGFVEEIIQAPHLTPKEVLALQSRLPSGGSLTREDVVKIGFDLHEDQLSSYVEHYLRYPQFAQVAQ